MLVVTEAPTACRRRAWHASDPLQFPRNTRVPKVKASEAAERGAQGEGRL